jgi:hypothetical protein
MAKKLGIILKGIQIPDHVLARLQESLAHDQEKAQDVMTARRNALQPRLSAVRRRMDQAYQDKLDGKIPEDFWERKMAEWTAEERSIHDALGRLEHTTNEQLLTVQRTLELANKAYSLYLTRNPQEQAELLRMVLLNCAIDAATIQPTYRKPFDLIFERAKNEEWSGRADLNCRPLAPQVEPLCGRERSGSPEAKSRAKRRTLKDLEVNCSRVMVGPSRRFSNCTDGRANFRTGVFNDLGWEFECLVAPRGRFSNSRRNL